MEKKVRDAISDNQVYLGIPLSELDLLEKYKAPDAEPRTGFYTDFSGVRTRLSYFGIASHPAEHKVGQIPFPDDALHAEAIEYLAAVVAVEQAQTSFTVVELGAGYGPWLVFCAKAAQRKGISNIRMLAVEADLQRHQLFYDNLRDNGLPLPAESQVAVSDEQLREGIQVRCIHGAISDKVGSVSFGSQSVLDWGASPIEGQGNEDYRGITVKTDLIDTYTIDAILADIHTVDFMHMDIQGFELKSIRASLDALQRKVRVLLIATHSRALEGGIIEMMHDNGWRLMYEKPCKFTPGTDSELTALTYLDGTQVWMNTRFGSPALLPPQTAPLPDSDAHHKLALEAVYSSTSWRITAPLRWLKERLAG